MAIGTAIAVAIGAVSENALQSSSSLFVRDELVYQRDVHVSNHVTDIIDGPINALSQCHTKDLRHHYTSTI